MAIIHKPYPAVIVNVVNYEPDQIVLFGREIMDDVIGTIWTQGSIHPADGRSWASPELHVWCPRLSWQTWKGPGGPAEVEVQIGPEGVQFVCLSRTRGKGRMVKYLGLNGSGIIPAGWGFVVAYGNALAGNQQCEQGNCFDPPDRDREVTGNGDLLLVR